MLVTMKEILERASREWYGVAAPNINSTLDAAAFIQAAEELSAPLILDVYCGIADKYHLCYAVREMAKDSPVPIAINLDHGDGMDNIYRAIQAGCTSVMYDCSTLPYAEHVAQMRKAVEAAHAVGISVEAELGHVGETENYEGSLQYKTDPAQAKQFIADTGVDCLAVAIGTAHGIYPKGMVPTIDLALLRKIKEETGNFPLVLHGSSGTPDEILEAAAKNGINKFNINGELLVAVTDTVHEREIKVYETWDVIRAALTAALKGKIRLYGSVGKAWVR